MDVSLNLTGDIHFVFSCIRQLIFNHEGKVSVNLKLVYSVSSLFH